MRDPKRIPAILKLIKEQWTKNPDLRLGQLLSNVSPTNYDIFFLEDDQLEAGLLAAKRKEGVIEC